MGGTLVRGRLRRPRGSRAAPNRRWDRLGRGGGSLPWPPDRGGTSARTSRTSPVPVLHLLRRGAAVPGVVAARLLRLRDVRCPVGRGRGQRGLQGTFESHVGHHAAGGMTASASVVNRS